MVLEFRCAQARTERQKSEKVQKQLRKAQEVNEQLEIENKARDHNYIDWRSKTRHGAACAVVATEPSGTRGGVWA